MTSESEVHVTTGTGIYYDGRSRMRPELLQQVREGEHVWVALAVHVVSAEALRSKGDLQMDAETLAQISVGCFICEQRFSERLSYRKCPGEPSP